MGVCIKTLIIYKIECMAKRGAFLAILAGVLLWIFLLTFPFTFASSPVFCNTCHNTLYTAWSRSPHANTGCLSCHQKKGFVGFLNFRLQIYAMTTSFLTRRFDKPIKAEIENENCLTCHQIVKEEPRTIRTIRVSHKEFLEKRLRCTSCHNTVTHSSAILRKNYPSMDKCLDCHNGEIASEECDVCHTTVTKSKKPEHGKGLLVIIHGREWQKNHGMGNLKTCSVCHKADFCVRCHQIELPHPEDLWPANHGKKAIEIVGSCGKCHVKNFCQSCHQIDMPHPPTFLREHSKISKKLGKNNCLGCHVETDCDDCHTRHIHPAKPGLTMPKPPGSKE